DHQREREARNDLLLHRHLHATASFAAATDDAYARRQCGGCRSATRVDAASTCVGPKGGSSTVMVVPLPASVSTRSDPRNSAVYRLTMPRPRPRPSWRAA